MIAHLYIEWRLTSATNFRLMELGLLLDDMEEGSDEYEAIKEDIKSLPGFPHAAPPESDFLLIVTDTQN